MGSTRRNRMNRRLRRDKATLSKQNRKADRRANKKKTIQKRRRRRTRRKGGEGSSADSMGTVSLSSDEGGARNNRRRALAAEARAAEEVAAADVAVAAADATGAAAEADSDSEPDFDALNEPYGSSAPERMSRQSSTDVECNFIRKANDAECGTENRCCIVCNPDDGIPKLVFQHHEYHPRDGQLGEGSFGVVSLWEPVPRTGVPTPANLAVKMVKRDADLLAEKRISKIISTINFSEQYNPIVPNYIISEPAQQIGDDGLPIHDEEEGGEEERFYAEHELTFGGEEEACPYIIMHAKDGTLFDFLYRNRPTWVNELLEQGGRDGGTGPGGMDPYTAMLAGIFKETVDNVRYLVTKDLYYTDLKLENLLYQAASPRTDGAFDWDHLTDNIKIYLADIGGIIYNGASDKAPGWGLMRNQIMNELEEGQTVEMFTPDKRWDKAEVQFLLEPGTSIYRLEDRYRAYDVPRERIRAIQWPTFSYAAMGSRKGPSPLPYGKGGDLAPGQINDVTLMNFYHQLIVLAQSRCSSSGGIRLQVERRIYGSMERPRPTCKVCGVGI